jgi:hypothetical protein
MQELDALADRYRVSSATIIRWSLRALANHVQRNEGRLVLPLELGDEGLVKSESLKNQRNAKPVRPAVRGGGAAKKRGV